MEAIITERLRLRSITPADARGLFAYLEHPRASCFLSLRLADLFAAEVEARARSGDDIQIAVRLRDSDRLIGDLFCVPEPPDTFTVGWNFNVDFGGAGFAREAARALFADLFTRRGSRSRRPADPLSGTAERPGIEQEGRNQRLFLIRQVT